MTELLPDETCVALLAGELPEDLEVLWTPPGDHNRIDKAINALEETEAPGKRLLLLQLPLSVKADIPKERFGSAKDFYKAEMCSRFLVFRTQRIQSLERNPGTVQIQAAKQDREWISLFLEEGLTLPSEAVVWVEGVNPSLDGLYLMKKGAPREARIEVRSVVFPRSRTPLTAASVEFLNEVVKGTALYEIQLSAEEESQRFLPPSQLPWPEEEEPAREDEAAVISRAELPSEFEQDVPAFLPPTAAVLTQPVEVRARSQATEAADAGWGVLQNQIQFKPLAAPAAEGGSVGCNPVEDLVSYNRDEPDFFQNRVLRAIVRDGANLSALLQNMGRHFGLSAMEGAFDSLTALTPEELHRPPPSIMGDAESVVAAPAQVHVTVPAVETIPVPALREYQAVAVDRIMEDGNFLVVAATGAGKTRIFIEVARRFLLTDPTYRVMVVVPKVALTTQHKASFLEHGFPQLGYEVGAFSGDSSATCGQMLKNSVIIVTAEKLSQHLKKQDLKFHDFQLLVLDEVHHTRGNHPYNEIMEMYNYLPKVLSGAVKVLGLTATPASGRTHTQVQSSLDNLLTALHVPKGENLIHISDSNPEIRQHIPQAEAQIIKVETRLKDEDMRRALCDFVGLFLTNLLPNHLQSAGLSALNAIRLPAYLAMLSDDSNTCQFQQWRYDMTSKMATMSLPAYQREDIEKAVLVVCLMEEAVQNSRDVGYETALREFLDRLVEMYRESKDVIVACEGAQQQQSLFKRVNAGLGNTSYMRMLPASIQTHGLAADPECGKFPKLKALIRVLEPHQDAENFHAMVFVRTRTGVQQICEMLRGSSLRHFMEFRHVVGRAKKKTQDQTFLPSTGNGMTLRQLNEELDWFKEHGRKVLVTTNVSEEGINVVSCELVVRYSPAMTGTEHLQSRGRARAEGARFVCIVEAGSKDEQYVRRCIKEAEDGKDALASRCDALQI